jgi:catechol 2,3-dioxygenase-like lactoylglutathione lyase family enzyme
MAVELNHTIIAANDAKASAVWLADMLGLDAPVELPPFWQVTTANGVNLDFHEEGSQHPIAARHYAFLISEDEFDEIFGRIVERGIEHYADPAGRQQGEINHHDGGRGTYFADPNGHWLEIITRPYGSGG